MTITLTRIGWCVAMFAWFMLTRSVEGQNEVEELLSEEPGERTLGHLIRGGHALADTFFSGVLDGSYNLGSHLGQLGTPGAGIGPAAGLYNRPFPGFYGYGLGGLGAGCAYGYGAGCLPSPQFPFNRHQPYDLAWEQGLHSPGFPGTYASRPYALLDRNTYSSIESNDDIDEIAKLLFT